MFTTLSQKYTLYILRITETVSTLNCNCSQVPTMLPSLFQTPDTQGHTGEHSETLSILQPTTHPPPPAQARLPSAERGLESTLRLRPLPPCLPACTAPQARRLPLRACSSCISTTHALMARTHLEM